MKRLRRALRRCILLSTDPHPPPWAAAWVWCGVFVVGWLFARASYPRSSSFADARPYGAFKQPDGTLHWGAWPGLPAEHFRVHVGWAYEIRPGRERITTSFRVERVPLHPRDPGPVLDSDITELRRLAAEHLRPYPHEEGVHATATRIAIDLIATGASVHGRVRPGQWVIVGLYYASIALTVATPMVGFMRLAQMNWFDIQARRAARGRCPECDYDLAGNATGACPECGAAVKMSSASARSGSGADPGTSPPSGARSRSPAS